MNNLDNYGIINAMIVKSVEHQLMIPQLIKDHLDYDGEDYSIRKTELWKIKATHGATIESAASLLLNGVFERDYSVNVEVEGARNFNNEFYTTPNPRFGFDVDALEGNFDIGEFSEIDAIKAAIEYAESSGSDYEGGVVIAFSGRLELDGAEIYVDPLAHTEASSGIELVLPQAPSIDVIHGIYPVNERAYNELYSFVINSVKSATLSK